VIQTTTLERRADRRSKLVSAASSHVAAEPEERMYSVIEAART